MKQRFAVNASDESDANHVKGMYTTLNVVCTAARQETAILQLSSWLSSSCTAF